MKRLIALSVMLLLAGASSGCCCLGPLFGMPYGGYYGGGGGCQPCGQTPYGGAYSYPTSPCGPGGCGSSYAPVGPNAYYGATYQTGMYSTTPVQTTMLNPLPVW